MRGESVSITSAKADTASWPAAFAIGNFSLPSNPYGKMRYFVIVNETTITSGQIDELEGIIAHGIGSETYLPAAHPYKTTPPLRS